MSGPKGGKIDWTDPEQVRAYHREYRRAWEERTGYEKKRREARRNRPAGDGTTRKDRKGLGFWEAAYTTENLLDELSWEIDTEKLRRNREE